MTVEVQTVVTVNQRISARTAKHTEQDVDVTTLQIVELR
jgi:hypothetical protein